MTGHIATRAATKSDAPAVKLTVAQLAALLSPNVLTFLALFALAPALPIMRTHFAATPNVDFLIQLVGGASGFAFAIGSLLVGQLISRVGYRSVYVVSLLLLSLAGAAAAAAPDLIMVIATRIIVGLAGAGVANAALVGVGVLLPGPSQARILGWQAALGSVAAIFAYPLIGQLAAIDWRLVFVFHLIVLVFVPLVLTLPKGERAAAAEKLPPAHQVGVLILASAVFVGMVMFISTIFGPLYLSNNGVTNAALLSIPPTAASAGGIIGSGGYGSMRARVGLAGSYAISLTLMAAGLAIAGLSASVVGVAAGSFLSAFGAGAFIPNLNATAILASPHNPGTALGVANALLFGSMILFPLVASAIAQAAGGPGHVLLGYAAISTLWAAFFLIGGKLRQMPADPESKRR